MYRRDIEAVDGTSSGGWSVGFSRTSRALVLKDKDMRPGCVPRGCYCTGQSLEIFFAKGSVRCEMYLGTCAMLQR